MSRLQMLVVVHECCKYLDKNHKVPMLVWVDHPLTDVRIDNTDITGLTWFGHLVGLFHLIWLEGLPGDTTCKLKITAHKDGFDDAVTTCELPPRECPRTKGTYGGAPHITSPGIDQSVHSNFPVTGYTDDSSQCPCTAWLADTAGYTYPSSPMAGQTAPNFGFYFQNIPGGPGQGAQYTLYVQTKDGVQASRTIYVQSGI